LTDYPVRDRQAPPPDECIKMFVNPEGWELVRTRNSKEMSKVQRFDYVLEKQLEDANKGIVLEWL